MNTFYIGKKKVQIPIVQGGMGIGISLGNLAGAVAKEGGIGTISAAHPGYLEADFLTNTIEANKRAIHKEMKKARAIAPDGVIAFNVMVAMNHYKEYVDTIIKAGADMIVSGAGLPVDLPAYTKEREIAIAPIVSTQKAAKVILRYWDKKYKVTADAIVIEGPLAGGHLGFSKEQIAYFTSRSYEEEIKKIIQTIREYEEQYGRKIPIILGGGIHTANDAKQAFSLGVDAIQVASRFVTTVECDANLHLKEAYCKAQSKDIEIVKSPVGMPGRALKNEFITKVLSGKRMPPKHCVNCIHTCNPATTPYCITEALIHAAKGETKEALVFCGANVGQTKKIETVKEVLDSFCII